MEKTASTATVLVCGTLGTARAADEVGTVRSSTANAVNGVPSSAPAKVSGISLNRISSVILGAS